MTRSQAAQRLLAMRNLRDAKEACEMGAHAIEGQPYVLAFGIFVGVLVGFIFGAWSVYAA